VLPEKEKIRSARRPDESEVDGTKVSFLSLLLAPGRGRDGRRGKGRQLWVRAARQEDEAMGGGLRRTKKWKGAGGEGEEDDAGPRRASCARGNRSTGAGRGRRGRDGTASDLTRLEIPGSSGRKKRRWEPGLALNHSSPTGSNPRCLTLLLNTPGYPRTLTGDCGPGP